MMGFARHRPREYRTRSARPYGTIKVRRNSRKTIRGAGEDARSLSAQIHVPLVTKSAQGDVHHRRPAHSDIKSALMRSISVRTRAFTLRQSRMLRQTNPRFDAVLLLGAWAPAGWPRGEGGSHRGRFDSVLQRLAHARSSSPFGR
jgi:hypothetical protein